MSRESRARLAAAQDEVVRALMGEGAVPPGFERDQVQVARRVLRDKQARIARQRAMARASAPRPQRVRALLVRLRNMLRPRTHD